MGHSSNDSTPVDLPYSEKILESVALIFVFVASSFLNITTCVIIARNKLLRSRPANVFVANLCLSNMVLTWFVVPFSLATLLWNKHDAYSGPACTFNGFFSVAACSAIVLTLCCISIDRYIAVTKSTRYRTILTTRRALYMLAVTWIQSLLFASFPVFGWSHYEYHPGTLHCSPSFSSDCSLYIFLSLIGFAIPIVVMVITYIKIFQVIRRHSRIITNLTMTSHIPVVSQGTLGDETQGDEFMVQGSSDSQSHLLNKTKPRKENQSPPLSPSSIITTHHDDKQSLHFVTPSHVLMRDLVTQSNQGSRETQHIMQRMTGDSNAANDNTSDAKNGTQFDYGMRDARDVTQSDGAMRDANIITQSDNKLRDLQPVPQSSIKLRDPQVLTQSNKMMRDSEQATQSINALRDVHVVAQSISMRDLDMVTQSSNTRDSHMAPRADNAERNESRDANVLMRSRKEVVDIQTETQPHETLSIITNPFAELNTTRYSKPAGGFHSDNDNTNTLESRLGISNPSMLDTKSPQGNHNDVMQTNNDVIQTATSSPTNFCLRKNIRRTSRKEYKIAKTGLLLLVLFLVLWLPYLVVNSCSTNIKAPERVFHLAMWLVYMNGVANPIAYAFNNTIVKSKLRQIFHRVCHPCAKK